MSQLDGSIDTPGHAHVINGLVREKAGHCILDPLLIGFGRGRMPPVQTIELQQQGLSQVTDGV
jgi:hypothetical protein